MNALSLMLALLMLPAASISLGDELRRNPFDHPKLDAPASEITARSGVVADETLRVSAILVAGDRSLVSLNGAILGIGEESFGYVLRKVDEEIAIFTRDGETITISLFEQGDDDDGT